MRWLTRSNGLTALSASDQPLGHIDLVNDSYAARTIDGVHAETFNTQEEAKAWLAETLAKEAQ